MPRGSRIRTCVHCSLMTVCGNGQLEGRCCEESRAALVQRRAYVLRRCHLASCACGDRLLLLGPLLRMALTWSPCSRSFPCRSSSSGIASLPSRRRKTERPHSLLARRSGRMFGLGCSSMCRISPDPIPPLAWQAARGWSAGAADGFDMQLGRLTDMSTILSQYVFPTRSLESTTAPCKPVYVHFDLFG